MVSLGATNQRTRKKRFSNVSAFKNHFCFQFSFIHLLLLTIFLNSALEQSTSGEREQGGQKSILSKLFFYKNLQLQPAWEDDVAGEERILGR